MFTTNFCFLKQGDEFEWSGAWSDKSSEWQFIPDYEKQEIGLTFEQDGEFWISYNDFKLNFDTIDICNLSPHSLANQDKGSYNIQWGLNIYEGEWIKGVSAGGCRNNIETFHSNPQYIMKLEHPDENDSDGHCTVFMALMQKNRRGKDIIKKEFCTIGFTVYLLNEEELHQKPLKKNFFLKNQSVSKSIFLNTRGVSGRFKLPPNHYLIVPSTFEPNKEGEFLIRIYSQVLKYAQS